MFDIITLGSATVDVFVRPSQKEFIKHAGHLDVCYHVGEKVLIDDLVMDTGGGGTNCAVAFARLGFRTGWYGALGDDHNADLVKAVLKKEKVKPLGPVLHGMTGYSVIMVGLRHDRFILTFKGVNDRLDKLPILRTKWLYMSSLTGPSEKLLAQAAAQCKRKGINYAFNPSMYLAEQGLEKLGDVIDGCSLLVLNKEEAAALLKVDLATHSIRLMLKDLAKLAKNVVITDGPAGAYATDGKRMLTIKPRPIEVVETTGAGDSFAAGVVAALMMRRPLAEGLRYGMAESESVISAIGAKNVLLTKRQLLKDAKRYSVATEVL
jgi:ribokinase